MDEIAKMKGTSGLSMVSTFSGCGGSCLGFEMAGFDVLWASEFVDAARETYERNHPGVIVDPRDIREVHAADILEATKLEVGQLDVFEGSPPCASFSTAGKRSKGWGEVSIYSDRKQRTDDLFFEYARLLDGLRPRAFVAENVAGLVRGVAKGYFKEILQTLRNCGYRVRASVLDAKWLGVPQMRQRLIFVGFREDLGIEPEHPAPLPYFYTLRDAFEFAGDRETEQDWKEASIEEYSIYPRWRKLKLGKADKERFNLVRAHPDLPCPCITQTGGNPGAASVCHPSEPRKFFIYELLAICGFPRDFEVTGRSYRQRWERLGRAVPPVMMNHIAAKVRDLLKEKDDEGS